MSRITAKFLSENIFDLARENNLLDEVYSSLVSFDDIVNKNSQLRSFVQSKKITKNEKHSILLEIFGKTIHPLVFELIFYMKGSHAIKMLHEILRYFSRSYKKSKDIVDVHAIVSEEMSNEQKDYIKNSIDKILNKNTEISVSVDKSIIGGIKLKINNTFLDASIQSQLQSLRNKLLLS